MGPSATVIADSISPDGDRLTTLEVKMHRFVLAEFNTHRVFSRNSASSRAIPVVKRLEQVRTDPALPVSWPAERPGMQGGEELDERTSFQLVEQWRADANAAADRAEYYMARGLHKSVTNRILEPYLWHTVVVSSTEWKNFFNQRCSPLAQPEIRLAAVAMRHALKGSQPVQLDWHHWHLPYLTYDDEVEIGDIEVAKQVSAARCARVSYLTHDGVRDLDKDVELYQRLVSADPPHASPLEHVAKPSSYTDIDSSWRHEGNFWGWEQLRHLVLGF